MYFKYNDELYASADVININCKFGKLTLAMYMNDDWIYITGPNINVIFEKITESIRKGETLIDIDKIIENLEE